MLCIIQYYYGDRIFTNGVDAMSFDVFEKEMNRGFIQLLVLLVLETPLYGYMIIRKIGDLGYQVEENTLYPLLRRLETKNILKSNWEIEENKPRKYYVITPLGRKLRTKLKEIREIQDAVIKKITGGSDDV